MGIASIRLGDGTEVRATYDDDALPPAGNDVSVSDGERDRGLTALRAALVASGRLGSEVDVSANVHFVQAAGDRRLATNSYSDTAALRNNGTLQLFRGINSGAPAAIPAGWAPMYNTTDPATGTRYTVYRGPETRDGDRTIPGRIVRIPLTGSGVPIPEVDVSDGHGPGWCPARLNDGTVVYSDIPALPRIPDAGYASSSANFWVTRGNRDGFTYFEGPGGQRSRRALPTEYEIAHPDPRRSPPRAEVFVNGDWRMADEGDHVPASSATAPALPPTVSLRIGESTRELTLTPAAGAPGPGNEGFSMFTFTEGSTTLTLRRATDNPNAPFQLQRPDGFHEIRADGTLNPQAVGGAPANETITDRGHRVSVTSVAADQRYYVDGGVRYERFQTAGANPTYYRRRVDDSNNPVPNTPWQKLSTGAHPAYANVVAGGGGPRVGGPTRSIAREIL